MYLGFFHTVMCDPRWIYMHHIQSGVLGRQTRVSNPLTLKLQAAAMWLLGTGPWSSVEHQCSSTDFSFWALAMTRSLEKSIVLFTPSSLSLECFSLREAKLSALQLSFRRVWRYVSRKHRYFPSFWFSSLHSIPEVLFLYNVLNKITLLCAIVHDWYLLKVICFWTNLSCF